MADMSFSNRAEKVSMGHFKENENGFIHIIVSPPSPSPVMQNKYPAYGTFFILRHMFDDFHDFCRRSRSLPGGRQNEHKCMFDDVHAFFRKIVIEVITSPPQALF